jgi:hypothetical protein
MTVFWLAVAATSAGAALALYVIGLLAAVGAL